MAVTAETVTAAKVAGNHMMYGFWTTDSTKGDHTITCPKNVAFFFACLDATATNPLLVFKHIDDDSDTQLTTGSTGVITSPTDATGVTITNATGGSGTTILVDSNSQTNSGENYWFAICKP